MTPVTDL